MDETVEEIRNIDLDIEALNARKAAIKQKAIEHRDSLSDSEQDKLRAEKTEIESKLLSLEQRKKDLQEQAKKQKIKTGENRTMDNALLHYQDGMERAEVFATAEYRSAYFKTMQGRDLSAEEKRAITSATDSGGAAIPTKTMNMILKRFL